MIGYDHRRSGTLSSLGFARVSAAVLLSEGFKVYLLEGLVPTPFVPFAVTTLKAAAGFMVTASHNPKQDDGFKVYWGNGSQIIPPHDDGIARMILANLRPWQNPYDTDGVPTHPLAEDVTERIAVEYFSRISELCTTKSDLKVVYTGKYR